MDKLAVKEEIIVAAVDENGFATVGEEQTTGLPFAQVVNALSQARKDKLAEEGDLINSLTTEKLNGRRFIPCTQTFRNIRWNPDPDGEPSILCQAPTATIGRNSDGEQLVCSSCGRTQFDNTKQGKDAKPTCDHSIVFTGIMADTLQPVVLGFSRTALANGKKFLAIAKSMRKPLCHFSYVIGTQEKSTGRNSWYVLYAAQPQQTNEEQQAEAAKYSVVESQVTSMLEASSMEKFVKELE